MSPAALSTHGSSALVDRPVAGTKVSCYTVTTISVNKAGATYDVVASKNSVHKSWLIICLLTVCLPAALTDRWPRSKGISPVNL